MNDVMTLGVVVGVVVVLYMQKERLHKHHAFSQWHHRHVDEKRERFCSVLASKHHRKKILGRVLVAWSSLIKNSWKLKNEKACQVRSGKTGGVVGQGCGKEERG